MHPVLVVVLRRPRRAAIVGFACLSSSPRSRLAAAREPGGIKRAAATPPSDMGDEGGKLDEYAVIREGEAEILMHRSNSVFYNKTQVSHSFDPLPLLGKFISF